MVSDTTSRANSLTALGIGALLGYVLARAQMASQAPPERSASLSRRSSRHHLTSSESTITFPEPATIHRRVFILLSGKRAAGKDHVARRIKAALWSRGIGCVRIALGDEAKRLYAEESGADFYRLLKDSAYREQHREGIARVREARIQQESDYFHQTVLRRSDATPAPVVLVTDVSFKFDIDFFAEHHEVVIIRVNASDSARMKRGWVPNSARDNEDSETALDLHRTFDLVYDNSEEADDAMLGGWVSGIALPLIKAKLRLLSPDSEEFVDHN